MALSDLEIEERYLLGEVVIHPFNRDDLGGASYDVRLGEYYYEATTVLHPLGNHYNIYSESHISVVWGQSRKARSRKAYYLNAALGPSGWDGIGADDLIIVIKPHGNLLCHTQEFIGARGNCTTMMKARSSIGRSMINVCSCAGMGDPGYFNRWTMEIHNRSDFYIPLVVGRRIAQIVFDATGPVSKPYGSGSTYQGTDDIDELVRSWTPEMMLPRLYEDRDVKR